MSYFYYTLLILILLIGAAPAGRAEPQIIEDQPTTLVYPPYWHTPFGIHRGTPELLALFVGDRTELDMPQDLACNLLLSDITSRSNGPEFQLTIIGANTGKGHLIYNPDLTHLEVIGDQGKTKNLFHTPLGVAMFSDGTTYVTDKGLPGVIRLQLQNKRLVPDGFLPPPPGGWQIPWGIALDSQGIIYVSDAGRNQIFIYSAAGKLLKTIGPRLSPEIQLNSPRSLTVADPLEQWSFYHDQYIFVCDQSGQRLLRLDHEGTVQRVLRAETLPAAEKAAAFAWLEIDYYENLWVTDPSRSQVHKFNRHLQYLTSYGQPGSGDYHFMHPTGIAIHRHFGQVFIAEAQGAHYFWIGTDILAPRISRETQQTNIIRLEFFLTEPSRMTIRAKIKDNAKSKLICKKRWLDSGKQTIFWQVPEDRNKNSVQFFLTAEATYSSAHYKAKQITVELPPVSISSSLP